MVWKCVMRCHYGSWSYRKLKNIPSVSNFMDQTDKQKTHSKIKLTNWLVSNSFENVFVILIDFRIIVTPFDIFMLLNKKLNAELAATFHNHGKIYTQVIVQYLTINWMGSLSVHVLDSWHTLKIFPISSLWSNISICFLSGDRQGWPLML